MKCGDKIRSWWKGMRNSWGFGVQSPTDYFFIRSVLREKSPYYVYDDFKSLRQEMGDMLPSYSKSVDYLLFRLANYVHPKHLVEVGTGSGLSTCYLTAACFQSDCMTLSATTEASDDVKKLLSDFPQITYKIGDELALFEDLLKQTGKLELLHVAHTEQWREVMERALDSFGEQSLAIIENYNATKEKKAWWTVLQQDERVDIVYEIGTVGLLFFNTHRYKTKYKVKLLSF